MQTEIKRRLLAPASPADHARDHDVELIHVSHTLKSRDGL